jgi:hypothetical protein
VGKKGKTPDLGQFTGNSGMKLFPCDPTNVSYVTDLFFGNIFFDFLCEETNLYSFQNCGKYDRNDKGFKSVDVTVAEMKKFFSIIILMGHTIKEENPGTSTNSALCCSTEGNVSKYITPSNITRSLGVS